jgi:hypothetical protein
MFLLFNLNFNKMKRLKNFPLFFLSVAVLLMVSSCGKDDSSDTTSFKKPSAGETADKIKVPQGMANSTNPYAVATTSYIQAAIALTSNFDSFSVPPGATESTKKSSGESHNWEWSNGTTTCWMSYWEDATKYNWKYEIATTGISRYTVLTAEENIDGSGGNVIFYQTAGVEALTYVWTLVDGKYTINLDVPGASLDIVINANGSGTMDFVQGADNCHIAWNADGSGSANGVSNGTSYSFSWTAQ